MFEFPYTCDGETKMYVDDCVIGRAVLRGPVTDYAGISTKKIQKQDNIFCAYEAEEVIAIISGAVEKSAAPFIWVIR